MYSKYFKRHERGVNMIIIKTEDCPENVDVLIRDIHERLGSGLANDWIYEEIRDAFLFFEEGNEQIQVEACPYYHLLYKWLDNGFAAGMINEYLENFTPTVTDIWEVIGAGQWYSKEAIYRSVQEFIEENKE